MRCENMTHFSVSVAVIKQLLDACRQCYDSRQRATVIAEAKTVFGPYLETYLALATASSCVTALTFII